MTTSDDDGGFEEYDTGPFCVHFSYSDDCEQVCANCGHFCLTHPDGDDCLAFQDNGQDCNCREFRAED